MCWRDRCWAQPAHHLLISLLLLFPLNPPPRLDRRLKIKSTPHNTIPDTDEVVTGKVKGVMLHVGQVLSETYELIAREKTAERPELVTLLSTPLEASGNNGKDLIPPAPTSRAYVEPIS